MNIVVYCTYILVDLLHTNQPPSFNTDPLMVSSAFKGATITPGKPSLHLSRSTALPSTLRASPHIRVNSLLQDLTFKSEMNICILKIYLV